MEADTGLGCRRVIIVVAGIAIVDGKVLLSQRPPGKHLAGLWEFPGGKIDAGETPEQALRREFMEELAVEIDAIRPYTFAFHRYAERDILLLFYFCRLLGQPQPTEDNPVRWIALRDLPTTPTPPADRELMERLASDRGWQ